MCRSSVVVFTAILAVIFLKKVLYRHHWTSIGAIVIGIALCGYASMTQEKNEGESSASQIAMGIGILLIGQLFGSIGYIIEEKFMGDFDDLDPYLMAGVEGVFGILMWLVILPILNVIPCDNVDLCSFGVVENTLETFEEYGREPIHFVWSTCTMIIVPLQYACGLSITKLGSAAQRTTIECARNITVWIFFLTVPVFGKITERFMWLQLAGFVILLLGVLVYNEILVLHFWKFDYYIGQAIAERED